MSVEVMAQVFKRYPVGGGEYVLALALADHAHDDGSHVYPSVRSLAIKTRQSERTVQRQLLKMVNEGWLVLVSKGGSGPKDTSEYCINPDWMDGVEFDDLPKVKGDILSPLVKANKGDIQNIKGDIAVSSKGDIAVSPESSLTIREPSDARERPAKQDSSSIIWDGVEKMFTGISEAQMQRWETAYPKIDVDGELTRMELWYDENPKKRKRNTSRFITGWLSRAFRDAQSASKPAQRGAKQGSVQPALQDRSNSSRATQPGAKVLPRGAV